MKLHNHILRWLFVFIFGLLAFSASAQADPCTLNADSQACAEVRNANLFYLDGGLLKQWNPTTNQIIDWGATYPYNEQPVISPDGRYFAYNSWATEAGNARREQEMGSFFQMLTNIWIYDYALGDAYRIAAQPAGASIREFEAVGIQRSTPVWSPNSRQLAWTQLYLPDYRYQLVVYDLDTRLTRIIVDPLPPGFQDGGFYLDVPRWGDGGISTTRIDFSPEGNPLQTLTVYDATNGAVRYEYVIGDFGNFVQDYVWMSNMPLTLGLFAGGGWSLLDLQSGMTPVASQPVRLVSTYAGVDGLSFTVQEAINPSVPRERWTWTAFNRNGAVIGNFNTFALEDVVVSAAGDRFGYINDEQLVLYSLTGQWSVMTTASTLRSAQGLIWSPTQWIYGVFADDVPVVGSCTQPTRLFLSAVAYVVPGMGTNALRDMPGLTASGSRVITQIPENGVVRLLDGPRCASGYQWWLVDYNGTIGWTPEGDGNAIYWLAQR